MNDETFYLNCFSYSKRNTGVQEWRDDFPSWAVVQRLEGNRATISSLFRNYLIEKMALIDFKTSDYFLNLNEKDEKIAKLYFLEGYSLIEIGAIIGLSEDKAAQKITKIVIKIIKFQFSEGCKCL